MTFTKSTFYLTFGAQYAHEPHPISRIPHPDGWVEIEAGNEEAARTVAVREFGPHWSFIYSNLDDLKPSYYPKGCLARFDSFGAITAGTDEPTTKGTANG